MMSRETEATLQFGRGWNHRGPGRRRGRGQGYQRHYREESQSSRKRRGNRSSYGYYDEDGGIRGIGSSAQTPWLSAAPSPHHSGPSSGKQARIRSPDYSYCDYGNGLTTEACTGNSYDYDESGDFLGEEFSRRRGASRRICEQRFTESPQDSGQTLGAAEYKKLLDKQLEDNNQIMRLRAQVQASENELEDSRQHFAQELEAKEEELMKHIADGKQFSQNLEKESQMRKDMQLKLRKQTAELEKRIEKETELRKGAEQKLKTQSELHVQERQQLVLERNKAKESCVKCYKKNEELILSMKQREKEAEQCKSRQQDAERRENLEMQSLRQLNQEMAEKDSKMIKFAEKLKETETMWNKAQAALKDMEEKLDVSVQDLEPVRAERDKLATENAQQEKKIGAMTKEITSLKTASKNLQTSIKAKDKELGKVNSDLKKATSDKTKLGAKVKTLKEQQTLSAKKLEEANISKSTLQGEKMDLETRVEAFQKDMGSLKSINNGLIAELRRKEEELQTAEKSVVEEKQSQKIALELTDVRAKVEMMEKELKRKTTEIQQLSEKAAEKDAKSRLIIMEQDKRLGKRKEKIAELEQKNEDLKISLDAKETRQELTSLLEQSAQFFRAMADKHKEFKILSDKLAQHCGKAFESDKSN